MPELHIPFNCQACGPFSALRLDLVRPGLWRHADTFWYRPPVGSGLPGPVVVDAGTETDLDSVPRLPFAYWLVKGRTVKGAAAHDHLYALGRLWRNGPEVSRAQADAIFLQAMKDEGAALRHRVAIYAAVRALGWRAWRRYRRAQALA